MSSDYAIEAEGLVKSYGDVKALAGVDLRAPAGSVLGLLGPNGAGKTTAVRILTTLLPPDSGTARVAGLDVVADAGALRSQIGLAGQYAAVDENLTGAENLELVGRLYHLGKSKSRERARDLLERFELDEAADRLARTYSGGMRRRLDLAAALMHNPDVLFLDEPTTGLDPVSRARVWEEVRRLNAELGVTIFLTTQYLEEADRLADRVGIIDKGRIVAEGTPAKLKRSVGQDLIVVSTRGKLNGAVERLRGLEAVERVEAHDGELTIATPDGPRVVGRVAIALEKAGLDVERLTLRTPTLDDVFLEVTGNRLGNIDDTDDKESQ